MSNLSIDRQQASETCEHCGKRYKVSRGSVYDDGVPFALYLAGMHGCGEPKSVVLAVAVKGVSDNPPAAVSLQVWPTEDEFRMEVLEPAVSPWRAYIYLGRMLTRKQALASPLLNAIFRVADHVVKDNPDVRRFLESAL